MLDLKNLSKIKYIYRIYEATDGILHCERFPVVYINSEVVYFKDARKKEYLNYIKVRNVTDNLTAFYNSGNYVKYYSYFDKYFWNVENNIQEIYEDLKKQKAEAQIKDEKEKAMSRYERAKREYEAALKEIEVMEQIKKALGNQN